MLIVVIIEATLVVMVFAIIITQTLIPLWKNEPLFPFFKRRKKLEEALMSAQGEIKEVELEEKIKKTKQEVRKRKVKLGTEGKQ